MSPAEIVLTAGKSVIVKSFGFFNCLKTTIPLSIFAFLTLPIVNSSS